jgi:hypothetical protein
MHQPLRRRARHPGATAAGFARNPGRPPPGHQGAEAPSQLVGQPLFRTDLIGADKGLQAGSASSTTNQPPGRRVDHGRQRLGALGEVDQNEADMDEVEATTRALILAHIVVADLKRSGTSRGRTAPTVRRSAVLPPFADCRASSPRRLSPDNDAPARVSADRRDSDRVPRLPRSPSESNEVAP